MQLTPGEHPFDQTLVRVAWLYFKEGRTQAEIADLLSTNRPRINKLINDARRTGLVTITLNTSLTSCIELEQELVGEFGLERAIILPTPKDPDMVAVLIGEATAQYLMQLLSSNEVSGVGTAWGATLREMVRFVPAAKYPQLCVSSVIGGLTRGLAINTFDIASDLARQLNAECAYLAAPVYADSAQSRDAILNQREFQSAFERIAKNDIILVSIGDLSDRSLLMRYGLPQDVELQSLLAAGAVGDVLGQFIDRDGVLIDHEINSRAVALPLAILAQVPRVIFAAGGMAKAAAIAGALRSRMGSALVCDEDTARRALALAREQR